MISANNDIRLLLVVGIAAMLLLFISFLLVFIFTQRKKLQYQQSLHTLQETQQNQLIEAAVRSEETERHRIADELHDEVGALLSASKLHLRSFKIDYSDESNKHLYVKGNELLDEAINKIRGIAQSLHSQILQEFGLNEAVKHFTDKLTQGSLIKVSISLDLTYTTQAPQKDFAIYRIIQELLNNIIKHANANNIHISSIYANYTLQVLISHNGNGLTQADFESLRYKKDGLGLKNILNRINLLKGIITFYKERNGYHIKMYIPNNQI